MKIKGKRGAGAVVKADAIDEEEEEEPLDFASEPEADGDDDGAAAASSSPRPAGPLRSLSSRCRAGAAALGAAAVAGRLQKAAGKIRAINPARAAAAYDLESQEVAHRAAGKAAVRRALAGALESDGGCCGGGGAAVDPFGQLGVEAAPRPRSGGFWRFLVTTLIIVPWGMVLLLSCAVNKWQLLWRPLGGAVWWAVDRLDRRAPALAEWLLWAKGFVSLAMHVVTVGVNLGVVWIMWDNGARFAPLAVVALYGFAHYAMAVVMFKELDLPEAGGGAFSDVVALGWRALDVLFYDVQLAASVVHGNRMMEAATQLAFRGYEEARVALTTLLFNIPCCILVGVEYGVFNSGDFFRQARRGLDLAVLSTYRGQLYAAVCFSVLNSLEKLLRLSLVDPWLHEKGDGFPILYVRSHAARPPPGLARDWLFRCREMLLARGGRLDLKELYAHYVTQVRGGAAPLADPHRAILLRKAVHYFNGGGRGAADQAALGRPVITSLAADRIAPGAQLCEMLADILGGAASVDSVDLSANALDDAAAGAIMDALRLAPAVQVQFLDLSDNCLGPQGCAAVAEAVGAPQCASLYSLRLARCPVGDGGAAALAEALKVNVGLFKLDLSDTEIGPEGAIALASALSVNSVLSILSLAGSPVGSQGVDALCRALRGNLALRELDVSRTGLDDRGASSIAQMLAVNKGLERLSLTHTAATDAGAQLICAGLQSNSTLQAIDVAGNAGMDKSWQKLLSHVVKGAGRQRA